MGSVPSQVAGNPTTNNSVRPGIEGDYLSQQIADYVASEYELEKTESELVEVDSKEELPSVHQLLTNFQENIDVVVVGSYVAICLVHLQALAQ